DIEPLAWALAAELGVGGVTTRPQIPESARRWIRAVADDLRSRDGQSTRQPRAPGTTLVVAGDRQAPAVHLLAHALNRHLGNIGQTVLLTAPAEAQPAIQTGRTSENTPNAAAVDRHESLRQLAAD